MINLYMKQFIKRFRNQWRIHHYWASIWMIIRMVWIQRKKKKVVVDLKDLKVKKLENIKNEF